ncbi:MAG: hypothetical protein IJI92_04440 [Erysipelotrichaceae bacterium]|nr:hypothetical protein [Erysipelotrichaceae bacterium]
MADNQNIDMFKLVQEVENQKKSLNIDDIFSDLDSVKNEEVKREEQKTYRNTAAADQTLISKPRIPENIGEYTTRFEAFRGVIEHVSYGTSNVNAYVEGHKDALEKYYSDAYNNHKDLYVTEARVNDEINRYSSHTQLYEKGYYDGLVYVLKALKRSKELMMARINSEINSKL